LLNHEEVILLSQNGKVALDVPNRAVRIRRALICTFFPSLFRLYWLRYLYSSRFTYSNFGVSDIPLTNYNYSRVLGACCENDARYILRPLGRAGLLTIDGELWPIGPILMATAEGTLVASISWGCKGVEEYRGPAIIFPSIVNAAAARAWINSEDGYSIMKENTLGSLNWSVWILWKRHLWLRNIVLWSQTLRVGRCDKQIIHLAKYQVLYYYNNIPTMIIQCTRHQARCEFTKNGDIWGDQTSVTGHRVTRSMYIYMQVLF
jgi:hypothetical protein